MFLNITGNTVENRLQLHYFRRIQSNASIKQEPSSIIIKVSFFSPTDALVSWLKKNRIKIYNKTVPTRFGVTVTPSSGSLLKLQLIKVH